MTFMFAQLLLVVLAAVASYFVSGRFMDVAFVGDMLEDKGISMDVLRLGPDVICVVLVSLALAYLFFSLIAGLSGAGCSSMDEIESANPGCYGRHFVRLHRRPGRSGRDRRRADRCVRGLPVFVRFYSAGLLYLRRYRMGTAFDELGRGSPVYRRDF